jgi:hypothetical protein
MTESELLALLEKYFDARPVDGPFVREKIVKKLELPEDTYDYSVKRIKIPEIEQLNLL